MGVLINNKNIFKDHFNITSDCLDDFKYFEQMIVRMCEMNAFELAGWKLYDSAL